MVNTRFTDPTTTIYNNNSIRHYNKTYFVTSTLLRIVVVTKIPLHDMMCDFLQSVHWNVVLYGQASLRRYAISPAWSMWNKLRSIRDPTFKISNTDQIVTLKLPVNKWPRIMKTNWSVRCVQFSRWLVNRSILYMLIEFTYHHSISAQTDKHDKHNWRYRHV